MLEVEWAHCGLCGAYAPECPAPVQWQAGEGESLSALSVWAQASSSGKATPTAMSSDTHKPSNCSCASTAIFLNVLIDSCGQSVCNLDAVCYRVTWRWIIKSVLLHWGSRTIFTLGWHWNTFSTQRSYLSFLWFHRERWRVLVSFGDSSVHVSCFSVRQNIILK